MLRRFLCFLGWHDFLLVYEDEVERLYSCRRPHGGDFCEVLRAQSVAARAKQPLSP